MPDAQVLNARQKRHQRMRSRILDNARALVHENGFEKLSLRAIARRVDYSPAGLYEYFDGKDAIIDALCEATDEQLAEAMQQALENDGELHPLVNLGEAYIQFALDNPDDFQLLFRRPLYDQESKAVLLIAEQVSESVDMGEFIPGFDFDEQEITHSIWALAHGIAMLGLTRQSYHRPEDINSHREMLQHLISGLRS